MGRVGGRPPVDAGPAGGPPLAAVLPIETGGLGWGLCLHKVGGLGCPSGGSLDAAHGLLTHPNFLSLSCPSPTPPQAQLPGCAWLMAPTAAPAAWRYGTVGAGAPCAMMAGTCGMPPWPVGSWAVGRRWPLPAAPSLERGPAPSFWTTFGVEGTRRPCAFAQPGPGASTTVTIARMLGLCVMVRGRGSVGRVRGLIPRHPSPSPDPPPGPHWHQQFPALGTGWQCLRASLHWDGATDLLWAGPGHRRSPVPEDGQCWVEPLLVAALTAASTLHPHLAFSTPKSQPSICSGSEGLGWVKGEAWW